MGQTINRFERQAFLKVSEGFQLMGEGILGWTAALNPVSASKQYVHQKSASNALSGYAPTISVNAEGFSDDPVVEYLMDLGRSLAIDEKAHTELVIVDLWTDPTGVACIATRVKVVISIDNPGSGEAGATLPVTATLSYESEPEVGTFNISTKSFVKDEE